MYLYKIGDKVIVSNEEAKKNFMVSKDSDGYCFLEFEKSARVSVVEGGTLSVGEARNNVQPL